MLKLFKAIAQETLAQAEETILDRNALLILNQQIRAAAADLAQSRRALAVAKVQHRSEQARRDGVVSRLTELEGSAVKALQGGREDLASEAAETIAGLEAERNVLGEARDQFAREITALHGGVAEASHRLAALERGRRIAAAAEALRRLKSGRAQPGRTAGASLRDAEDTLRRLRDKQTEAVELDSALDEVDACVSIAGRLEAEGFGQRAGPTAAGVMERLRQRAGAALDASPDQFLLSAAEEKSR